jgi:hypothetical protein
MRELPKNEKTFYFEHTDEFDRKFDGQFTVKCILTMADKIDLDLDSARIMGDVKNPSRFLQSRAHIIATLRVKIIKAPTWWEQSVGGLTIEDEAILVALYDKVIEQEKLWRQELKDQAVSNQPV